MWLFHKKKMRFFWGDRFPVLTTPFFGYFMLFSSVIKNHCKVENSWKKIFFQGENVLSGGHEHDEQFSLTNLFSKTNRLKMGLRKNYFWDYPQNTWKNRFFGFLHTSLLPYSLTSPKSYCDILIFGHCLYKLTKFENNAWGGTPPLRHPPPSKIDFQHGAWNLHETFYRCSTHKGTSVKKFSRL